MHKSAIFVEIRGALGMSQNPLFSPTLLACRTGVIVLKTRMQETVNENAVSMRRDLLKI